MVIYLVIYFFLVLATLVDSFESKVSAKLILFGTLGILLFITTVRDGIGTDFYNYKNIYDLITVNHEYTKEFGFVILNYFAFFTGGFKILLFLSAIINISIIYYILNKLNLNIYIGILTYYSMFFLNHNFNTIRHGLLSTLVWLAFYFYIKKEKLKSFVSFILAFLFHQIAVIIYPFQFFAKLQIKALTSCILLVAFFYVGILLKDYFSFLNLFSFENSYTSKVNYYLNDYNMAEEVRYKFGLGFIFYILLYFTILKFNFYFQNNNQIIFFNRILFLAISMLCIFASLSILSERVANTLLLSIIFIFSSIGKLKVKLVYKIPFLIVVILINFFYLFKVISMDGIDRPLQFVPYNWSLSFQ